VIFAEYGEGGALAAAPIARRVLDAYFQAKAERAQAGAAQVGGSAAQASGQSAAIGASALVKPPQTVAQIDLSTIPLGD
jgi:hypothetical protein